MPNNLEILLRKFGKNSNSFLAMYPGYQYFYHEQPDLGCIPYVRTRTAWVGLGEPLCPPDQKTALLRAFAREAASESKAAVLLPVEPEFRVLAEQSGFKAFQIGSEPYFDLSIYPASGGDWLDVSHSAKALKLSKGFSVREVSLENASRALRLELGQLLQDWIESRKMGELGFVNRVEPYTLSHFKKYFLVEGEDRTWGFLACIPIWGSEGWYFVDVIRRKESPAGSIELLMLEAMKSLKAEGAKWISLGVSPLAKLETNASREASLASKMTPFFFNHAQWFYNFQSLYNFKAKFHPSEWRSSYVIHNFNRTDSRLLRALVEAFVPQGPWVALGQIVERKLDVRAYFRDMNRWVCDGVILRGGIGSPLEAIFRAPISTLLVFSWIIFYSVYGPDRNDMGFSFGVLREISGVEGIWKVLLQPGFLHWNFGHLLLNSLTFAAVGFSLEIFCGPMILILAFSLGLLFANSLTAVMFWAFSRVLPLDVLTATLSTVDVGASLGIFGCAGVWGYLLRNKALIWFTAPAVILLVGIFTADFFQINHIVAALLGFGAARLYFGKILS